MPINESAATALIAKLAPTLGATMLGAAVMSVFDPPKTKRDLFKHGLSAGAGWMIFGESAHKVATHFITQVDGDTLKMPSYFMVGCLAWAFFAAVSKFRVLLAERGANKAADSFGMKE